MSSVDAWRRALMLAGAVVVLDQATKQIAIAELAGEGPRHLALGFELDYVTNTGIAFGFLGDGAALVLAITIATLAGLLVWFATAPTRPGLWIATGLLIGGALGNLADRVRVDAVTDFIDPPYWPAFNLADIAITAGVLTLALVYLQPGEG